MSEEAAVETKVSIDSRELQYGTRIVRHPKYRYTNIAGQYNSRVPLSLTCGQKSLFEIPATTVFNFAQSYLEFDFIPPNCGVGRYNWIYANGVALFSRIQARTRGKLILGNMRMPEHITVWFFAVK